MPSSLEGSTAPLPASPGDATSGPAWVLTAGRRAVPSRCDLAFLFSPGWCRGVPWVTPSPCTPGLGHRLLGAASERASAWLHPGGFWPSRYHRYVTAFGK